MMAEINQPVAQGYAPVNGLNMYYEIYGNGDMPLVLIHGGGSTIETSLGNLLPYLSRKVIAVELQAHGRTSDRDTPESFERDAADVVGLLKHLKIDKANFLGFSNGGSTTLQIAIRYPEMVNKAIAISACYKRDGMIPGFFEMMGKTNIDEMPDLLKNGYRKVAPNPEQLQVMFEKDVARMLAFTDWPDENLQAIKAPVLIMAADQDVIMTEHTVQIAKLIPGAQLIILPGVHGSFIGEVCAVKEGSKMTELSAGLIMEFLNA